MALNWTLLSEDGSRPLPLPDEKIFYAVEGCKMHLDFSGAREGVQWKAEGKAFVTSQRIVFVRLPPLPAPADPAQPSAHLRSLSVPLFQFLDTRYYIPVFGAPYYEATIVPTEDGGLPQRAQGVELGLLKIRFNQGGGIAFRDAVHEVKTIRGDGASHVEALPIYEPPAEGSASRPPAWSEGSPSASAQRAQALLPDFVRATRSDSMPNAYDIAAAYVAREAEAQERDAERRQAQGGRYSGLASSQPPEANEGPPAYAA